MPVLVFRALARRELAEIAAHVAREAQDREAGRRFARRLVAHCERLARLPGLLGRPRPECGTDYRSSVHESHLIVFRYSDPGGSRSRLIVVHILSGRRDVAALFTRSGIDP